MSIFKKSVFYFDIIFQDSVNIGLIVIFLLSRESYTFPYEIAVAFVTITVFATYFEKK